MTEWWTYRPSDFLLFSTRVYERLIESHNAGLWPWHLLAVALGVLALAFAWRGGKAGRAALAIGGAGLAFSGWSFLWSRYAGINWAAGYFAPAFWVAGALFAAGAVATREPFVAGRGPRVFSVALMLLSVAYPLVAPATGKDLRAAEVAGLTPDPTALMALALAALMANRLAAAALSLVPLAWSLYAAMTLWTLGASQAWAIAAGLALYAIAAAMRFVAAR